MTKLHASQLGNSYSALCTSIANQSYIYVYIYMLMLLNVEHDVHDGKLKLRDQKCNVNQFTLSGKVLHPYESFAERPKKFAQHA